MAQYPYYWQFGFRPPDGTILDIESNLDLIYSKRTGDCFKDGTGLATFIGTYKVDDNILNYISDHPAQPLIKTLQYISNNYCPDYHKFYQDLYVMLGLTRIEGMDAVYRLHL